jgi:hypothetical protein
VLVSFLKTHAKMVKKAAGGFGGSAELSTHQRSYPDQFWDSQKAEKGVQIDRKRRQINVIEMSYTPTAGTI